MAFDSQDIPRIIQWLSNAGQLALSKQASPIIKIKADGTPVSDAEISIEKFLVDKIRQEFPVASILGEEGDVISGTSSSCWIIDPIDGTKPYLLGLPNWGISLAYFYQGKITAGFFYMPATNEYYYGWEKGTFFNGTQLTGLIKQPFDSPTQFLAVYSSAHQEYEISYPRLQAYGSTAAHLAYLARGLAIGVLTRRVNLWDFAAFLPIFKHVGITAEYLSGNQIDLSELLRGQKTPEPILAAPHQWLSALREGVFAKK